MNRNLIALAAVTAVLWSQPAFAQEIDLSAVDSLLNSILTGISSSSASTQTARPRRLLQLQNLHSSRAHLSTKRLPLAGKASGTT